jgi:hypothetical protein
VSKNDRQSGWVGCYDSGVWGLGGDLCVGVLVSVSQGGKEAAAEMHAACWAPALLFTHGSTRGSSHTPTSTLPTAPPTQSTNLAATRLHHPAAAITQSLKTARPTLPASNCLFDTFAKQRTSGSSWPPLAFYNWCRIEYRSLAVRYKTTWGWRPPTEPRLGWRRRTLVHPPVMAVSHSILAINTALKSM